jgi:multicomponent Na+:H+ antiporter subunit D
VLVALTVAVPLGGAVVTAVVGGRARPRAGLGLAVTTAAVTAVLAATVWRDGTVAVVVPGPADLDLVLAADGLAAAMLAMTGTVGFSVAAFATLHHRLEPTSEHRAYWPLLFLLWATMHTLFLAGDLFTIYLMLELVAVTGAALVVLGGDRPALLAGTRYFYAELIASATFLLGAALVWAEAGTVALAAMPAGLATTPFGGAGLALMTLGLLLKVPLFPLHFWLPPAHSLAPSAVSPILSAVVVKTAFAVLIRLWFIAMPGAGPTAAQLLGALGASAVVWGSVNALRAGPVKVLLAHSTVAQLGLLFLLVPLAQAGSSDAWIGGVVQAVAHALAKAAALVAAVVIVRDAAGDRVSDLAGTAARRPVATFAFGVAGLSLVGLPPSAGFVAKWHLLLASFETGQWWWIPVVVVGSLLTAGYLMRVVKQSFAPGPGGVRPGPVRDLREVVALTLALAALGLGLRPTELLELLQVGGPALVPGGG